MTLVAFRSFIDPTRLKMAIHSHSQPMSSHLELRFIRLRLKLECVVAGSKSNYLENVLLDLVLGAHSWTPPTVIYVALSSQVYAEGSVGTNFNEITGAGAARVAVANNATNWPTSGTSSQKSNAATITFPAATNTWLEARSFYLLDSITAGNILYGGDLVTPRTLQPGDTASFGPGAILITED